MDWAGRETQTAWRRISTDVSIILTTDNDDGTGLLKDPNHFWAVLSERKLRPIQQPLTTVRFR